MTGNEGRIVVDIRSNHSTGVSRYGVALTSELLRRRPDLDLRVLCASGQADQLAGARRRDVIVVDTPPAFDRRDDEVLALCDGADLYFTTNYVYDLRIECPVVFTVHDLTRIVLPDHTMTRETFTTKYGRAEWQRVTAGRDTGNDDGSELFVAYFRELNREMLRRAAAVAVVSNSTADDLRRTFPRSTTPIVLVPGAADAGTFWPRSADEQRRAVERSGVDGPFLIWVGLAGPHKRWEWLRDVWSRRRSDLPTGLRLVTVGGHVPEDPNDRHAGIRHLGRVADETLAALYSGSLAFVSASLKEGNNLPPKEAALCGTDRVLTDIPSFRETVGPDALYYDPGSEDEFVAAVGAAWERRSDRPRRIRQEDSWTASALAVGRVLDEQLTTSSKWAV